ncbi:hypothetical protein QBC37DRAFT_54625 [Rhypophila decipiens]|uniref:Tetratricopeptide repeat protein n=1 Tax=Rhypophila decipiens TaxID=261697 RepID=A0AAN6XYQ4_9PEZI|nr:hypothetical protein QBC37DRAFT_54625 [Rhypophila decipiens]
MGRPDDLLLREIGALAHLFSGNYAQALRMFESMCDRCREYEGESHCRQFVLRAKEGLAMARGVVGIGETEHEFRLVIDLEKCHLGEEHPDIYTTYHRFAMVLATRGRVEDAQRWYSQAAKGRKERLGPDHPLTRHSERMVVEVADTVSSAALGTGVAGKVGE